MTLSDDALTGDDHVQDADDTHTHAGEKVDTHTMEEQKIRVLETDGSINDRYK